jgi:murein DD-endopeptidase MepM/ murein hydrolase activator NlpD
VGLFYGLYGLTQQAAHLRTNLKISACVLKTNASVRNSKSSTTALRRLKTPRANWPRNRVWLKTTLFNARHWRPGAAAGRDGPGDLHCKDGPSRRRYARLRGILRQRGYTPTVWPVEGTLEGGFGGRGIHLAAGYEFHSGQDIEAPWGAPVVAGASGRVSFVGWQNGYGQLVVVDHGGGLTTRYGHLSHIDVELNQTVSRAQFLGKVGSTGRSTGPHLHYEVRINDQAVNPLQYLLLSTKVAVDSSAN